MTLLSAVSSESRPLPQNSPLEQRPDQPDADCVAILAVHGVGQESGRRISTIQVVRDGQNRVVSGETALGDSEPCHQFHGGADCSRDAIPASFKELHVVAVEIGDPEPHAADVSKHQAGLEQKVLGEAEAVPDLIDFVHCAVDLFAGVEVRPLCRGHAHEHVRIA